MLGGDVLGSVIIGGVIAGFGSGMVLREGASGGGQDIIGIYMMKRNNNFSVGKIAVMINVLVYGICLWLYDVTTVIYSVIFLLVSSFVTDRVHLQNITQVGLIITQRQEEVVELLHNLERSATLINGFGSYTEAPCQMVYTVLSKYEARLVAGQIRKVDPGAFTVFYEANRIIGNYNKHL